MKYTKRLLFAAFLAVVTFSTSASAREVDLKINGSVGLGTSYAAVIKNLGKPSKIKKEKSIDVCGDGKPYTATTISYPGLIIELSDISHNGTFVGSIELTSSKWSLGSGIKVGATQKEVIARFGKTSDVTKTSLIYTNKGNDGGAEFKFKAGKLVSVNWGSAFC